MGVEANVGHMEFPKQSVWYGKQCIVVFHYDTGLHRTGRIVRDDAEAPYRTIIQLDDGRFVLGTECQFRVME